MEDKRTLVAFLVIGLMLLLLPFYYEWMGLTAPAPQPSSPQEPTGRAVEGGEPARGVLPPQQPTPGKPAEAPSAAAAAPGAVASGSRDIVVRTPLQELVFSTAGGVVTSCRLPGYRLVGGGVVELVPPAGRGLALSLEGQQGSESLAQTEFWASHDSLAVPGGERAVLRMAAELGGGRRVEKVFTFHGDRYGFELELACEGVGDDTQLMVGWQGGIAATERDLQTDVREARVLAYFNDNLTTVRTEDAGTTEEWRDKGSLQWAGVRSKYFLLALATAGGERYSVALQGMGAGAEHMPDYSFEVGTQLQGGGRWPTLVYLGPLNYDSLRLHGADLEQAIDFGWPVVRQVSQLLLIFFRAAYAYIPNYGWIIVVFAVAIKILVYPLTHKTYESTSRMQELQPKIAALRERYKSDPQRLSRETMKLYKEHGVNPLGGCLPLLLQMPIFFALYNLFGKTIELRQAPFALWIDDLSVPDQVVVGGVGVHVLPLLMAVSMFVQQKMTMKDPKQAFLVYFMPIMMTFIFWNMTSGLVLYWTVFNVLTIGQQFLVDRLRQARSLRAG
ncbi:MAG: membrane protein insertase YidC [Candidatus Latescibacterota bacterium]